jgi:hypothetical protein
MDALHVHGGVGLGALHDSAERRRMIHERALQDRRDLEALGHDVVGDEMLSIGLGEDRLHFREILGLQDPRLVAEHVQSGSNRRDHAIDLAAVAAGEHDDVAWTLPEHPLEKIGACVDLRLPGRRPLRAVVESCDAFQMLEQIEPERREDVHARRHARIHLPLNERCVKVPGIEGHETHISHGTRALLAAGGGAADDGGCKQQVEHWSHHQNLIDSIPAAIGWPAIMARLTGIVFISPTPAV